jgi:hypothetical protein
MNPLKRFVILKELEKNKAKKKVAPGSNLEYNKATF